MPLSRLIARMAACLCGLLALISCVTENSGRQDPGPVQGIWADSSFYPSGKLQTVQMMKDSLKQGYFLTLYETGERMKQGHYVDGEKRGWFFYWWMNGQLNQEWYIKPGETLAICVKVWDENGAATREDQCDAQNYQDTTYRQLTRL
jgi:hypothetical protein